MFITQKLNVLGYTGELTTGSHGYYVLFYDHPLIVDEIAKLLHIYNEFNLNWNNILSKIKFKGNVYTCCIFPEFEYLSDLQNFILYINSNQKFKTHFINLKYFI